MSKVSKKSDRKIEYIVLAVFLTLLMLSYGKRLADDFGATGYATEGSSDLSGDEDKDLVPDKDDKCPGTLENVAVLEGKLSSMSEDEWKRYEDLVGCSCEQVFSHSRKLFGDCLISFGVSRGLINPDGSEIKSGLNFKSAYSFVVYGDSRGGNDIHKQIVDKIKEENPNFIVSTGDVVHKDSPTTTWDQFLNIIEPIKNKLYVVIGNHEYGDGGGDVEFFENMERLDKMKEKAKDKNNNPSTYFSVQEDNIYLIILNRARDEDGNQHNLDQDKEQQSWLENELINANKLKKEGKVDFIFVFFHVPLEQIFGDKKEDKFPERDGNTYLAWVHDTSRESVRILAQSAKEKKA